MRSIYRLPVNTVQFRMWYNGRDMKLVILYKPDSEHSRTMETFVHDFEQRHGAMVRKIEVLNSQSREGMATMSLYDIMQQPAILVLRDDGQLANFWAGPQLPLMDEVAAYFSGE